MNNTFRDGRHRLDFTTPAVRGVRVRVVGAPEGERAGLREVRFFEADD
jgi:hypothetical protein